MLKLTRLLDNFHLTELRLEGKRLWLNPEQEKLLKRINELAHKIKRRVNRGGNT